jgi:PAS domain S-box-containing protein
MTNRSKKKTTTDTTEPQPVLVTDADGFVLFLNEPGERLTGYRAGEALGLPLARFFADDHVTQSSQILETLARSASVSIPEFTLIKQDGNSVTTELTGYSLSGHGHFPPIRLFILKDPFRLLVESEEVHFLEKAVESIREGVLITDLTGTIVYVNGAIRSMFGYDAVDVVGRNITVLFVLPGSNTLSYEILSNTVDGSWEREITAVSNEGTRFVVRLKTSLLIQEKRKSAYIVGIIQDITKEVEMREKLLSTNRELSALYAVSTALAESIELDELLFISLVKVLEVMGMDLGVIRILNEEGTDLVLKTHVRVSQDYLDKYRRMPVEGSVSGKVVKTGVPHLSSRDIPEPPEKQAVLMSEGLYQVTVVPIRSKDKTLGTLSAGVYERRASITQDMKLLVSIGNLIGVAVENSLIYERADRLAREKDLKVGELSLLMDLSGALLTTIELNKLIYIVLTAATFGETFGFNRAAVFLVDEEEMTITGTMGVGPTSPEEAGRIWVELEQQKPSIFEIVQKDFEKHGSPDTIQNRTLRKISISLDRKDDVVVRSILEKRPIIVSGVKTNPHVDDVMKRILMGGDEFACIPIIALDRPLGAILVDNVFNRKPIREEDIVLLTAFANQAGLAIQNSIVYTNKERINRELREAQAKLLQQAKLVGLGEMASEMAHEIRNPLVSIGGFARKISEAARDDPKLSRYSQIVVKEVMKLEHTLQNILSFPREIPPAIGVVDFNGVIRDTLGLVIDDLAVKKIQLKTEFSETMPSIEADADQLRQVFLNLFYNAVQAMEGGGQLTVITTIEQIGALPYVRAEVRDTGPGVPSDIIGNIFKPFFTTKKSGTGLGLAITHKIVTNHGGSIDIINRPEGGASFIVEVPVQQPKHNE